MNNGDKLIVEVRIARARRFGVYVDEFILEDRCKSLSSRSCRAGWAHNL